MCQRNADSPLRCPIEIVVVLRGQVDWQFRIKGLGFFRDFEKCLAAAAGNSLAIAILHGDLQRALRDRDWLVRDDHFPVRMADKSNHARDSRLQRQRPDYANEVVSITRKTRSR